MTTWSDRLRRVSQWRDIALAAVLCALGELELFAGEKYNGRPVWPGPRWASAILVVVLTAPFIWRRRRPLAAVLVVFAALAVSSLTLGGSESATGFIVLIAATFSGAAYSRRIVIVIAAGVIASVAHGLNDPSSEGIADLTWTYGLVAISALLGRAVWSRQHRIGSLQDDAAAERLRHEQQVAEATAAERASIARELHDIVSHAVSVIVIQAQVGSRALADEPSVAASSLTAIEASARTAMAELRQLLTLLAPDERTDPAAVTPAASLHQLDDVIAHCRATGLRIDADIDQTLAPGSAVADLAAYRVLQEALTNAMRHAPGAAVSLRVRRHDGMLELLAEDDGGTSPAPPSPGTGRGLIGMRERLALAGGRLVEAGPSGTGFRVRALLPLDEHRQGVETVR